jgi:zinc protease
MDGAFYGGKSLVDELSDRLPHMTVDDVNHAVRRHIAPDDLQMAVIADPDGAPRFVEALAANEPSPVAYDSATRPEVLAEDREIAEEELRFDSARCRIVPAESMFE